MIATLSDDEVARIAKAVVELLRPMLSARPDADSGLLTKQQLATHFRVSTATIDRWDRDSCPHLRIGGCKRYRVEEVEAWQRSRSATSTTNLDSRSHGGVRLVSKIPL